MNYWITCTFETTDETPKAGSGYRQIRGRTTEDKANCLSSSTRLKKLADEETVWPLEYAINLTEEICSYGRETRRRFDATRASTR